MKILKKLALTALLFSAGQAFIFADAVSDYIDAYKAEADSYISTFNSGLDDFSSELGFSVPQAAVQQNVYAEAFIGKVFPSVPPHFAVGINAGMTHLNTSALAKAASKLGISGVKDDFFFPVFNADLRIGGVFLPFDVGFSFMTLDVSKLNSMDVDFTAEFLTFAFDARYALLEDGLALPAVSVGLGYSLNKGSFGATNDKAEAMVDYNVHTLYAQVQVSKTLNIPVVKIGFTPFLGLRGVISNYDNDWSWKFKGDYEAAMNTAGLSSSGKGTASSDGFGGFQPQIYGGLGFNFVFVQVTASICADLRHLGGDSSLWSGAMSIRFKM
ncbi:MAG: hypothetical protein IJ257_04600 [Treponema sp.]|nr:hypothetical protein [Treponema sp.]